MVMIICFGADCDAVFDKKSTFESYDTCYSTAMQTANYMKNMFPQSAGEVHCWNEVEVKTFEKFLEEGGKPSINPNRLPKSQVRDA